MEWGDLREVFASSLGIQNNAEHCRDLDISLIILYPVYRKLFDTVCGDRKEHDMSDRKTAVKTDDEAAVLEKVAAMPEPYREMGERLHALILRSAPDLHPRLWYGMPGYAKGGPVLCFFRVDKYMTFGLTEHATFELEEGATDQLMPSSWFFTALDDATEAKIADIVRKGTR